MTTLDATPALSTTRRALQAVAEHVLSAALHAANGHIGLRATPGGFGTPPFAHGGSTRQILVDGTALEVREGDTTRRAPITTLRAAGELVGVDPGAPRDVYTPATPLDLDAPLVIDAGHARVLAEWRALVDEALDQLRTETSDEAPGSIQLWPEHFDLATTISEVTYGGSPGDDLHDVPYLYVSPWDPPTRDDFWNEPFGASRAADVITSAADALSFFRQGRARARLTGVPAEI